MFLYMHRYVVILSVFVYGMLCYAIRLIYWFTLYIGVVFYLAHFGGIAIRVITIVGRKRDTQNGSSSRSRQSYTTAKATE